MPTNNCPRWLNLGCGSSWHPHWINLDFHDHGGKVIAYDLRLGIPFSDCSFDVVYHSHILEHFQHDYAKRFLQECLRVLKPHGLLRVVVPNLEDIVCAYIAAINGVRNNEEGAKERHRWMQIELLDQLTRQHKGGEMLKYWQQNPLPQEDFIIQRCGQEAINAIANNRARASVHAMPEATLPLLSHSDPAFQESGELHRWMYDAISLQEALAQTGFTDIMRQEFNTSMQPEILSSQLDELATPPDDLPKRARKPDSLFMEARKPATLHTEQSSPLRVTLFNTRDTGGAGLAAVRLQTTLRTISNETGANVYSHMYTGRQQSFHAGVHLCPTARQKTIAANGEVWILSTLRQQQHQDTTLHRYPHRPPHAEYFTVPGYSCQLDTLPLANDMDVINLHWISGLLEPALEVDALKGRPIVWTLHDMNAFTGGCHYSDGCRKFEQHCGACPLLGSTDEQDISRQTWRARKAAYRQLDLHIVTPSKWLAHEVTQSSLLKQFPVHVIANGQPMDIFTPLQRDTIRASLDLKPENIVVAFASHSLTNKRKGGEYLLQLLHLMARTPYASKIVVLLAGSNPAQEFFQSGIRVENMGQISGDKYMAAFYNAADAVVVPSLEDNLPNVICESLACGTPVIAFASGGIPEMIRHAHTGWLAQPSNTQDLVAGVEWLQAQSNKNMLRRMCRIFALEAWNPTARAQDYLQLFKNITSK